MELESGVFNTASISTLNSLNQQICPECGAAMIEADRLRENGALYIWYVCTENGCEGSWLMQY